MKTFQSQEAVPSNFFRDVAKKNGKMWEFGKNRGGGSTQIPLPFFTVFNMGDPPTINVSKVLKCKINHFFLLKNMTFPNGGEGGVPDLGRFPHFPVFCC